MSFIEFVKLIGALLGSIGGATVVVIGLAKWFGDFLSRRLLDSYNNKYQSELEGIKNKYQSQLETLKDDLERAKTQFMRYSEKQFELYNDLWKVLLYTKHQADSLWEMATPEKIPAFGEQVKLTRNAVDENLLLIEEQHYTSLIELIKHFEEFQFGKVKLVDIRSNIQNLEDPITVAEAQYTIDSNRETKERYDRLIMEIGRSFREQIKG